ncbi:hypothetical protein NEOLI_000829 [Neolecta irregularis DAH-3]|uniref:Uncharacterized protein n=1 Tax=Neolecta irregularis (strain DAH-3) TaxID=1198029 RepID=A0A1U7LRP4_NEOID|nr:hypothetical protein NEOLI_000829 [Neolecta irregularis DAH-3]|eukprot:OLL25253.1 hypothetical protein NEOLI_000829 [Neolecta irregularis DAH-3]
MPNKADVSRTIGKLIGETKSKASSVRVKVSQVWTKTRRLNPFHVAVKPMRSFSVLHRRNDEAWRLSLSFPGDSGWKAENKDPMIRRHTCYGALETARERVDWSFLYNEEKLVEAIQGSESQTGSVDGNFNSSADQEIAPAKDHTSILPSEEGSCPESKSRLFVEEQIIEPGRPMRPHLSVISKLPQANEGLPSCTAPSFRISFVHEHNSLPSSDEAPDKEASAVDTVRNALITVWNHSSSDLRRETSYIDLEEEFSKSLRQRESIWVTR